MIDEQDPKILMEEAKKGNTEAFSLLYERYLTPLYRYIYFRVSQKEEAEDIVQSVFLKVYKALARFKDQGKDPLSFFYAVARNAVIDYKRKKREIVSDESHELIQRFVDDSPDLRSILEKKEHVALVNAALSQMQPDHREVLTMKLIHELSHAEIAQLLSKTEVAVRQICSRGVRTLRAVVTASSKSILS